MADGDILLCKGSGLVPNLIRWNTSSAYSHVAVVASESLGLIIESVPQTGVRAIGAETFRKDFDRFRIKAGDHYDLAGVISYLIKMLTKKYDFGGAMNLGWRNLSLVRLFALKVLKQKKAADRLQIDQDYFCSELCYEAYFAGGGLDIVPQIPDTEITSPGDIARSPIIEKVNA